MAVAPPIYVPAPPVTPARYGLLTAGDLVVDTDPHMRNGIEWQDPPCGPAKLDAAACNEPHDRTDVADGMPVGTAGPIVVYNGFTCRVVGLDEPTLLERARAALANGEAAAVEQALWASAERRLMETGPNATVELSAAPVSLVKGVGLLEAHLRSEYGGIGVIHAPALVAAHAARDRQVSTEAGQKVTELGHRWSFGTYPNTGPDGVAAEADTAWLVATGAITYRRTEARVRPGSLAEALDTLTNEVFAIAERTYVVNWSCVRAAVQVSLT